jgi:tetratricopeptide (TPR) repeat protein
MQPARQSSSAQLHGALTSNFEAAQTLVQQGRLDEAKSALTVELQQNPSSVPAYNLLGIVDSEQQDYAGAIAALKKALELAPSSLQAHNNLGKVYVAEKQLDSAEKEFEASLRLDAQDRDANFNLGMLLMARGLPAEAIPHFERVHPADHETRLRLIQAYFESKRSAEALRMADTFAAQNKNDFGLCLSLGILLASDGQYKAAQLELEQADLLQPGTFDVLYNLGQTFLLSGQFAKAELQLTRARALKPQSPETLFLLGQIYWKQSRPSDALDVLVQAHKLDTENTDIILLMAQISIAQGYVADAIPLLQEGLKIAPQRVDLHSALGESYFKADQIPKALDEFQQVVQMQPSLRAYAFLGLADTDLGRFDAAKLDFQHGLKLDPHDSFCLFNLGYIAERQGDTAAAAASFEKVIHADPDFSDALLELANLRIETNRLPEAEALLNRYVQLSPHPESGYYKLAVVERKLHKTEEANRDLARFQTLSKNEPPHTYLYENLFDYLDHRAKLSPGARNRQDLEDLQDQVKKHPDQPEGLYLLAQAYLRSGDIDDARSTIAHLNEVQAGDYRDLAGAGVLLARFHLYDDAIRQFQAALEANPGSDDLRFDLADALFRKGRYAEALDAAQQVSAQEHNDGAYLALVGDIDSHLGDMAAAEEMERAAIERSPDNDQNYLSLALLQLRENQPAEAKRTLLKGQTRMPASGKIYWGLGLASVMEGNTAEAAEQFERAVDLLPEWVGCYSMLGVFYYQTGQIGRSREVLDRLKETGASGGLDLDRIEQVLDAASQTEAGNNAAAAPLSMEKRVQLLRMAIQLVDKTM